MKISRALPIISFIIVLILVVINMTQDDYIVVENRVKEDFPKLSVDAILDRQYQEGIESYFGDQVIAEAKFIEVKSQYEILIGNGIIRDSVFVGQDMFFSKTTLNDINGVLLPEEKLLETVGYLKEIAEYYRERNYDFYFGIGPNKASIYGEKLNNLDLASYRVSHQLKDELIKNTDINYIDLNQPLLDSKDQGLLYFSYDSHWNYLGGLIASKQILNSLYENHEIDFEAYKDGLVYEKSESTDLANIIGVSQLYFDTTYVPTDKVNYYKDFMDFSSDVDDELIVIRDSFFDSLGPVFEELDISKKYVAFLSNYKEGYEPSKSKGKVLLLVVERNIYPSIKGAHDTIFE